MNPDKLAKAMSLLTRPVPPARRPPAKPQASWQTLKVGQRLKSLTEIIIGIETIPTGNIWEVTETTSQGATIRCSAWPVTTRLPNGLQWKLRFERLPATPKRKVKVIK